MKKRFAHDLRAQSETEVFERPRGHDQQGAVLHDREPRSRVLAAESGPGRDHQGRRSERPGFRDARGRAVWLIVGSGLSGSSAETQDGLRHAERLGINCIAVNDAWQLVPWARALYAADLEWWQVHAEEVRRQFAGELWSQWHKGDTRCGRIEGLRLVEGRHGVGLSREPSSILFNGHSGAQAMQLAAMWGAEVLVLVGFDYDEPGAHFFGEHPPACRKPFNAKQYLAATNQLIGELAARGIPTVNCSPTKKLTCKSLPLGETIARLRADS